MELRFQSEINVLFQSFHHIVAVLLMLIFFFDYGTCLCLFSGNLPPQIFNISRLHAVLNQPVELFVFARDPDGTSVNFQVPDGIVTQTFGSTLNGQTNAKLTWNPTSLTPFDLRYAKAKTS